MLYDISIFVSQLVSAIIPMLGYLSVLGIIILVISAGIVIIVLNIVKAKESGDYTKVKHNLIVVLCLITAFISWVTNFGLIRFIMTFLGIPFIHALIFFFVNNFAVLYIKKSNSLKVLTICSYISYILGYAFLPDGWNEAYVFFGLIHNEFIIDASLAIAGIGFLGSGGLLLTQLIMSIVISVQAKRLNKENK